MNKCSGCGSLLQTIDCKLEGYTKSLDNPLCERCFRIKHYNDYQVLIKDNVDYIDILNSINKTNDLVILVVDLFSIPAHLAEIRNIINNNPMLLVLTKRDLLPKSLYEDKIINYFNQYHLGVCDTILISSNTNYHLDELLIKIKQYKTSTKVYVIGYTNAGKSSMMNKLLYNYTDNKFSSITTSILPSTTLNTIEAIIDDDLTLIDTPGLLENGSIANFISVDTLKKITPMKTIRPITYQVKGHQIFIIDEILRLDCNSSNSITFFLSNKLVINRIYKDKDNLIDLTKHILNIKGHQDIVITGLGFIKIIEACIITVYTINGVDVYLRDSLI